MPKTAEIRAVGELAASRHGVFNLSQAAECGVSRRALERLERDGTILRIRPSTWVFNGCRIDWLTRLYAATLDGPVGSFFSATALHGLDGLSVAPALPEILVVHGTSVRIRDAVVRSTRLLPVEDVVVVDGIRCTTIARTLCDVAPLISAGQLVRAIDDVQRRGVSMVWLMQRAEALQVSGRAGPSQVIDVVRRRVNGYRVPDSWFERLLQSCLRSPMLSDVVRQHELRTPSGRFVARFDLAIPRVRLGIEAHSRSYHLGEIVEQHDEDRDMRAAQEGWEISYQGFAATRSPVDVCRNIELIVARRALDLDLPPLPTRTLL